MNITSNNNTEERNKMNKTTDAEVIQRLIGGQVGQRVAAEIMQEAYNERLALLDELTPLRKAREIQQSIYKKEVAKTLPLKLKLEAALKEAEEAHYKVMATEQQSKMSYSVRSNHVMARIAATAPESIDALIKEMTNLEMDARQIKIEPKSVLTGNRFPATGKKEKGYYGLIPSLNRRLEAIRAARAQATLLKEEVLEAGELKGRLDALRDSIPALKGEYLHSK